LLSEGENPKVVSKRLGHASITLTLDVLWPYLAALIGAKAERRMHSRTKRTGSKPDVIFVGMNFSFQ
jgi:hypothetical protein